VVAQLQGKRLGVHSEMIGDGLLSLIESGAVTNRRKNFMPGKMVATFALGSESSTASWTAARISSCTADFTNDPCRRPERPAGVAQRHAAGGPAGPVRLREPGRPALLRHRRPERLRARGQPLARGQGHHGAASTAKGDTVSRIVPTLSPGTHVSTGKNDVNYVVTEYGVARLRGRPRTSGWRP
jgi:hypothetical protein